VRERLIRGNARPAATKRNSLERRTQLERERECECKHRPPATKRLLFLADAPATAARSRGRREREPKVAFLPRARVLRLKNFVSATASRAPVRKGSEREREREERRERATFRLAAKFSAARTPPNTRHARPLITITHLIIHSYLAHVFCFNNRIKYVSK